MVDFLDEQNMDFALVDEKVGQPSLLEGCDGL